MRTFLKSNGILSLLLIVAMPVKAAVEYTVTDLGVFSPRAINSSGVIVGLYNWGLLGNVESEASLV